MGRHEGPRGIARPSNESRNTDRLEYSIGGIAGCDIENATRPILFGDIQAWRHSILEVANARVGNCSGHKASMKNIIPVVPFADKPVVICAGGPSLTLAQVRIVGMARSRDMCRVIAVNDAVYPCWFADILHAGDERWHRRHGTLSRFAGMKTAIQPTEFPDVRILENSGPDYIGDEGLRLGHWKNSGAQAVHLAARLFARRIFLLGFDYSGSRETKDGTRDHWFGRHTDTPGCRMDINSDVVELRRLFRVLTDHLQSNGVEIVNCSPGSTIDWLPVSTIEQEFIIV